jgi:ribose/xylose/arabinose/galactoside ABC-type transport system permease subunit
MTLQDTGTRAPEAAPIEEPGAGRAALLGQVGVPVILVLLIVVFSITADDFLSGSNIKTIFSDAAFPTIVAVGLTICLAMGEFDLSLNGVAGLATIVVAVLVSRKGMATVPAILITLVACGLAVGIVNGALVGFLGVNALIVTIAVNSALLGLEYVVSDTKQIFGGFPSGFVSFCRGDVGPVPNIVIVAGAVALAIWATLEHTTLGRQMRAVGGNAEAARIAGVDTARTKVWGFALCSLLAALAGTLFAGKQTAAFPLSGLDVLLPSYAACFIGAATFKVGEFNVPGTIIGVFIATITANGLLLMGVANYATYLIQAGILLGALVFARIVSRRGTVV